MIGPGKYNDECTLIRERTEADAVLLIITNGTKGSGFSCQFKLVNGRVAQLATLPSILRNVADQIEADHQQGGPL